MTRARKTVASIILALFGVASSPCSVWSWSRPPEQPGPANIAIGSCVWGFAWAVTWAARELIPPAAGE